MFVTGGSMMRRTALPSLLEISFRLATIPNGFWPRLNFLKEAFGSSLANPFLLKLKTTFSILIRDYGE